MDQTVSYTVREKTFLPLLLMSTLCYSVSKVARIGVGYLYDRSSGSSTISAQKADQIVQWVSAEVDIEVERHLVMAFVIARKLHRKRCLWVGFTYAMALAGGNGCKSGATVQIQ